MIVKMNSKKKLQLPLFANLEFGTPCTPLHHHVVICSYCIYAHSAICQLSQMEKAGQVYLYQISKKSIAYSIFSFKDFFIDLTVN